MKQYVWSLFERFNRWQMRSLIRLIEEDARLRCEENARQREAIRGYFDQHYPSPSGTRWSRHE